MIFLSKPQRDEDIDVPTEACPRKTKRTTANGYTIYDVKLSALVSKRKTMETQSGNCPRDVHDRHHNRA